LLRSEDGVIDTFRVNPAVVPRQEQQAFIPIYVRRTIENRSKAEIKIFNCQDISGNPLRGNEGRRQGAWSLREVVPVDGRRDGRASSSIERDRQVNFKFKISDFRASEDRINL
jgi:hypothetical protein